MLVLGVNFKFRYKMPDAEFRIGHKIKRIFP